MAINDMILDKIVEKCKEDVNMRAFIVEILKLEAEKTAHYRDKYKDLIKHYVSGDDDSEN